MVRASITEAKNQLSRYLERVKAGETILITDRGLPVARLEPVTASAPEDETEEERIERLIRAGVLIRPKRKGGVKLLPFPKGLKKLTRRNSLSQAIIDERNEERREQGLL